MLIPMIPRHILAIATLLLALAAAAACDDSGDSSQDEDHIISATVEFEPTLLITPTPPLPPGATATAMSAAAADTSQANDPDCDPGLQHASGDSDASITSGGLERTYILHVPRSYDGATATPLVINLHGFGSNARDQALYSRFPQKADDEGFIVVSPNGSGTPQMWTFPGLGDVDDAAFISGLIDALQQQLCIDADRVFLAGMSNGAAISTFIACALPDRIAAIAEVAATAGPRLCATDQPIPIITFRATEDQCVPYEGGTSACGMRLPVIAAEESLLLWARHNRCSESPAIERISEHVVRTSYGACAAGAYAVMYTTEGDGHTWPGSTFVPRLGPVTQEIDATSLVWDFFLAHPR
jgi:polyhydroxybutyrate depolymerase